MFLDIKEGDELTTHVVDLMNKDEFITRISGVCSLFIT